MRGAWRYLLVLQRSKRVLCSSLLPAVAALGVLGCLSLVKHSHLLGPGLPGCGQDFHLLGVLGG